MDNKITNNIIAKTRTKIAIAKFETIDKEVVGKNSSKLVASFILAMTITGGLVYATGNAIYEKIWKEPEGYKIRQELTEEEKEKCLTEEEAKEIGNQYLKKIGFDEQTIKNLDLKKEFLQNKNIWSMSSEKVSMKIDAESGKIKSVSIPTYQYKIPYDYGITREEARKVAKELLEKYKPEGDKRRLSID